MEPLYEQPQETPEAGRVPRCEWDRRLVAALAAEARPEPVLAARLRAVEHGCLTLAEVRSAYAPAAGPP